MDKEFKRAVVTGLVAMLNALTEPSPPTPVIAKRFRGNEKERGVSLPESYEDGDINPSKINKEEINESTETDKSQPDGSLSTREQVGLDSGSGDTEAPSPSAVFRGFGHFKRGQHHSNS